METTKKPTIMPAALVTATLVCCLISLLLMVISGNYSKPLMFFQVLTMALLILSAIISWRAYTKKFVDYEVQHRLEEQGNQ